MARLWWCVVFSTGSLVWLRRSFYWRIPTAQCTKSRQFSIQFYILAACSLVRGANCVLWSRASSLFCGLVVCVYWWYAPSRLTCCLDAYLIYCWSMNIGGHCPVRLVKVTYIDLSWFTLILHLRSHYPTLERWSCRCWDANLGLWSTATIAVSSAKVLITVWLDFGRSDVYMV
jgi:hypothetical protein